MPRPRPIILPTPQAYPQREGRAFNMTMGDPAKLIDLVRLFKGLPSLEEERKLKQQQTQNLNIVEALSGEPTSTPESNRILQLLSGGEAGREMLKSEHEFNLKKLLSEPELPYKLGVRQKFTGKDGKAYEGTFKGLTEINEPVFENVSEVMEKDTGMKEGTKEYLYGQVISQFDNDDTVKQFRKTQLALPYIIQAEQTYKRTGNAGILQDALIYSHNKILDADSVVMVSEYLRSKKQSHLLDRVQGNIFKLYEGSAGLGPEQQQIMLDAVKYALKEKTKLYDQRVKAHRTRASRYNDNKNEINEMFPESNMLYNETVLPERESPKQSNKQGSKQGGKQKSIQQMSDEELLQELNR